MRAPSLCLVLVCALAACSDDSSTKSDGKVADATAGDSQALDNALTPDKQGSGKVVYKDVNPDKTVTGWNMFRIKFDESLPLQESQFTLWIHPIPDVQIMSHHADCHVLVDGSGYPLALAKDAAISSAQSTWKSAQASVSTNYLDLNKQGTQGNFIGVTDKYLGIRFKKAGAWHYGWIRMDVDATPSKFTVKDYAHQSVGGVAIKAGEGAS